jgi:hypothetical protein
MRPLWNPHTLSFTFEVPEMPQSEGVQKILGFSRGWHHWNSVRLGIHKENDYCVLYLYAYARGERTILRLGKFDIGNRVMCQLSWDNGVVAVANSKWQGVKAPLISMPIGYLLFPYFETDSPENKVMPFDVRIWDVKVNGKLIKI